MKLIKKTDDFSIWQIGENYRLTIFGIGSVLFENKHKAQILLNLASTLKKMGFKRQTIKLKIKQIAYSMFFQTCNNPKFNIDGVIDDCHFFEQNGRWKDWED